MLNSNGTRNRIHNCNNNKNAKARKRIETNFSQFVEQFMLNRNYAKQIEEFMIRIISKISTFTIIQYVNYLLDKPIGHIKYALD